MWGGGREDAGWEGEQEELQRTHVGGEPSAEGRKLTFSRNTALRFQWFSLTLRVLVLEAADISTASSISLFVITGQAARATFIADVTEVLAL